MSEEPEMESCWVTLDRDPINDDLGVMTVHKLAWGVCGVAAMIAVVISIFNIFHHATNYSMPSQQRYIIRILLFVPIYAICTLLSFLFFQYAPYIEMARDAYECLLLTSFLMLLCNYLTDDPVVVSLEPTARIPQRIRGFFPMCCLHFNPTSPAFLSGCRLLVLQYIVVKPCVTVAAIVAHAYNRLCPSSFSPQYANIWIKLINTVSMLAAMQGLVLIYLAIRTEIQSHEPFMKFLAVKLAIFLIAIQTMIFGVLAHAHVFPTLPYWTPENIATGLNALVISIELIAFALFHMFAFDYYEYKQRMPHARPMGNPKSQPSAMRASPLDALLDAVNPLDLLRELGRSINAFFSRSAAGGRRGIRHSQVNVEKASHASVPGLHQHDGAQPSPKETLDHRDLESGDRHVVVALSPSPRHSRAVACETDNVGPMHRASYTRGSTDLAGAMARRQTLRYSALTVLSRHHSGRHGQHGPDPSHARSTLRVSVSAAQSLPSSMPGSYRGYSNFDYEPDAMSVLIYSPRRTSTLTDYSAVMMGDGVLSICHDDQQGPVPRIPTLHTGQ
ncbi:organic solute transporter Ostalpha-domain-containing protein [Thamnocephalis sphaerospora]|uniref:Organic solute transporter Ostalpha-domain-containing protein n=1 Tax=Thamnocephalis sphaerospora TaxID=78915 RepID=A0A4P9XNB9_9FUNG|nr:organic solute transporter Ostalpha-domain-containing protein [Thamnocephalis sphaerospora]|eukprot:RKP07457.1 organic solute transporter Ostalpha-domain-containing protein [Thamnocephalis sphaerospora]